MRSEVTVRLADGREFRSGLDAQAPLAPEAARAWLDAQFVRLECEPLRASGKLLRADQLLVVARAAGPELLGDASWMAEFARAASAVLAKPVVRLDLGTLTVGY
jgi:hypothetical protein